MTSLNLDHFVAVRTALAQRIADAKFLAKGRVNRAQNPDSEEMLSGGEAEEVAPAIFHLSYENAAGEYSERVVTVRRVERRGDQAMLHCFCHLRNAPRAFTTDRISEVFDAMTGEVFSEAGQYFTQHPLFTNPRQPEQEALKICRDEINILTVVGAADGLFDPDEQDRVLMHVFDRCDHLTLDEAEVRHLLARIAPDQSSFSSSLTQMQRFKRGGSRALMRTLRKLVDADGILAPEEVAFVHEIEARLTDRH